MTLQPVRVAWSAQAGSARVEFPVRRMQLVERIDRPFEATLELVTGDLDIDVRELLGTRATIELQRDGDRARSLVGWVTSSAYVTTLHDQLTLRVVVEPSLALLRTSSRRRIFTDQTLPEILQAVCEPVFAACGGAWDFSWLSRLLPHDYVVQYDESDLAFVLRLLGEAGLCLLQPGPQCGAVYSLSRSQSGLLALGGDPCADAEDPEVVGFEPDVKVHATEPSVQYLGRVDRAHTRTLTAVARDWKTPHGRVFDSELDLGPGHARSGHRFVYHPHRVDEGQGSAGAAVDDTEAWARRQLDECRAEAVRVSGSSNLVGLAAGSVFELSGHPHPDLDARYVVRSVVHQVEAPHVELDSGEAVTASYSNRFDVQRFEDGPLCPPLPRGNARRIGGIETATVVGPEHAPDAKGVCTDALGRVRVQFHWDHARSQSAWLRVMSPWAGPGYGASFVPRVGMEVVVGWLGGDPNRPVVMGCLYTGTHVPPGELPHTSTQTVLRTQSLWPEGDAEAEGFNELSFEDLPGSERVYVHAQRDFVAQVRHDARTEIDRSRALRVGAGSSRRVGGSEVVHVGTGGRGDLNVSVADTHGLQASDMQWRAHNSLMACAQSFVQLACGAPSEHASGAFTADPSLLELDPTAGRLEAPARLELRVGNSAIVLTPDAVTIECERLNGVVGADLRMSTPGGHISMDRAGAELSGGAHDESVLRLNQTRFSCHAKDTIEQFASKVSTMAEDWARLTSKNTRVSGQRVDVHGAGLVDVRGKPIHLNC